MDSKKGVDAKIVCPDGRVAEGLAWVEPSIDGHEVFIKLPFMSVQAALAFINEIKA